MFGFFIIRKLFDISCISDHVQPISKLLSVVLAECGHFLVTWSVQEMWSLGLCRNIPAQSCVIMWSPGLRNIPALSTQVYAGICLQSQNPLIYVHAHV